MQVSVFSQRNFLKDTFPLLLSWKATLPLPAYRASLGHRCWLDIKAASAVIEDHGGVLFCRKRKKAFVLEECYIDLRQMLSDSEHRWLIL